MKTLDSEIRRGNHGKMGGSPWNTPQKAGNKITEGNND